MIMGMNHDNMVVGDGLDMKAWNGDGYNETVELKIRFDHD